MRGYVPWADWLLYGGLALVAVVGAVIAAITPQYWDTGKILVLILVPAAFVVVASIVLISKYWSRPDFISKHNISVWTDGIAIDKDQFERLTYVFVRILPALIQTYIPKEDEDRRSLSTGALRAMLHNARVEWRKKPITLLSRLGWSVKDKAGLQQGRGVMLHWTGSIVSSAYYHELLHMVDEVILKREPDYAHRDVNWWGLVAHLKRAAATDALNP